MTETNISYASSILSYHLMLQETEVIQFASIKIINKIIEKHEKRCSTFLNILFDMDV